MMVPHYRALSSIEWHLFPVQGEHSNLVPEVLSEKSEFVNRTLHTLSSEVSKISSQHLWTLFTQELTTLTSKCLAYFPSFPSTSLIQSSTFSNLPKLAQQCLHTKLNTEDSQGTKCHLYPLTKTTIPILSPSFVFLHDISCHLSLKTSCKIWAYMQRCINLAILLLNCTRISCQRDTTSAQT